ncbi:MAG: M1 family aminopeptidase, partial [Planctomycetota bacterium JB042]
MSRLPALPLVLALVSAAPLAGATSSEEVTASFRHVLGVRLDPAAHALEVEDTITFRDGGAGLERGPNGGVRFTLHDGLEVTVEGDGWSVARGGEAMRTGFGTPTPRREWELSREGAIEPGATVTLRYEGTIHHPLETDGEEYARSFSSTPGTIGEEGVYLAYASAWVPEFSGGGAGLVDFELTVVLPDGWDAVSQGRRTGKKMTRKMPPDVIVTWDCPHPMEEIYLVAARFHEFERAAGDVAARVFLREPDANLANKYLEATAQYLAMYHEMIGPYPFAKFALVENFWETGYGMPSFTLLGPQVIRFPFILHSSYPHEILHNWWGNSVYVDYEGGNWCEGLTAYLADHLIKEGQGQGVEYRRDTLKKYRDYVRAGRDLPLERFRSRHSSATEAVGYGKALMLFHMLRRDLGDRDFAASLRRFYQRFRFRRASWDDLADVFSETARQDVRPMVRQWVERTGAPALAMEVAVPAPGKLRVHVRQTQEEEPFVVNVPVAITVAGEPTARIETLALSKRTESFSFDLGGDAVRVDLDPGFDVFRRLDREELPPTLGEVFGAPAVTVVVPSKEEGAWRALAEKWTQGQDDVVVETDAALAAFPSDRAVWVLGRTNAFADVVLDALPGDRLDESRDALSVVYVARHPADPDVAIGYVATDVPAAVPGLARKLPHYGKYSYLGFLGDEPTNVDKGQWEATDSPLVAFPTPRRAALPAREPLARPKPVFDPAALMEHVRFLAADEQEGRGVGSAGHGRSAARIAAAFEEAGLRPGGDAGTYFLRWTAPGGPDGAPVELATVVGVLPGTRA